MTLNRMSYCFTHDTKACQCSYSLLIDVLITEGCHVYNPNQITVLLLNHIWPPDCCFLSHRMLSLSTFLPGHFIYIYLYNRFLVPFQLVPSGKIFLHSPCCHQNLNSTIVSFQALFLRTRQQPRCQVHYSCCALQVLQTLVRFNVHAHFPPCLCLHHLYLDIANGTYFLQVHVAFQPFMPSLIKVWTEVTLHLFALTLPYSASLLPRFTLCFQNLLHISSCF